MELELTAEQIKQIEEDEYLEIKNKDSGFYLYLDIGTLKNIGYFEYYWHPAGKHKSSNFRAFSGTELDLLKPTRPYMPTFGHVLACSTCNTPLIYNFDYCPKCGQKIDYSKEP